MNDKFYLRDLAFNYLPAFLQSLHTATIEIWECNRKMRIKDEYLILLLEVWGQRWAVLEKFGKKYWGRWKCLMEENFCWGRSWFGAGCWGGTPLGQWPRLGTDTIERESFRLIKWVTASGCRIEDMDSLRMRKSKLEKGKHKNTPQIGLAGGGNLI